MTKTVFKTLGLGLVALALAASPTLAQNCDLMDSGEARPQYMKDRLPECGGVAPVGGPEGGPGSLTTFFASNNGGSATGGIYFDLEVVGGADLLVTGWDTNLDAAFTGDVSVWWRSGTFSGAETSPVGWNLVGTDTGVASAGDDVPTPLSVGTFVLTNGATTGIAVSLVPTGGGTGNIYTNGTGGNEIHNNGTLELRAGSANNVAFSSAIFTPRVWNGTVYYDLAAPPVPLIEVPTVNYVGLALLLLCLGGAGFFLIRRRGIA